METSVNRKIEGAGLFAALIETIEGPILENGIRPCVVSNESVAKAKQDVISAWEKRHRLNQWNKPFSFLSLAARSHIPTKDHPGELWWPPKEYIGGLADHHEYFCDDKGRPDLITTQPYITTASRFNCGRFSKAKKELAKKGLAFCTLGRQPGWYYPGRCAVIGICRKDNFRFKHLTNQDQFRAWLRFQREATVYTLRLVRAVLKLERSLTDKQRRERRARLKHLGGVQQKQAEREQNALIAQRSADALKRIKKRIEAGDLAFTEQFPDVVDEVFSDQRRRVAEQADQKRLVREMMHMATEQAEEEYDYQMMKEERRFNAFLDLQEAICDFTDERFDRDNPKYIEQFNREEQNK